MGAWHYVLTKLRDRLPASCRLDEGFGEPLAVGWQHNHMRAAENIGHVAPEAYEFDNAFISPGIDQSLRHTGRSRKRRDGSTTVTGPSGSGAGVKTLRSTPEPGIISAFPARSTPKPWIVIRSLSF